MPLPFRVVCDLLQSLDDEHNDQKSHKTPDHVLVARWFVENRQRLDAPNSDACAILSTLLPEKRTDRVFSIQNLKLEGIIGQALGLGSSRVEELRLYRKAGLGRDLADCVEAILNRTPNCISPEEITVEAIDAALAQVAARNNFSSPAVRAMHRNTDIRASKEVIGDIYRQLSARDAKWFTRLVLKDYQGVSLNHQVVFRNYHPLLPQMLKIRDDLNITRMFLRQAANESADSERLRSLLKPKLGIKVGRQPWYKGRSIKHCVDMCRLRTVACEQKLDGEYCQIHIDRSRKDKCIQIFSKSGKDSTADKSKVHDAIKRALKLNKPDCPFKQSCILEGELVVWSTKKRAILPFHKIRKHVTRGGRLLGTWNDSQPHAHEQLMIVYFDLLMVDNESLLTKRHSERRHRLTEIVNCEEGIADVIRLETIHFSRNTAAAQLRNAFAKCILNRSEGLVLKPDEPYFDFTTTYRQHACGNIKVKKEYFQGMGDVGDFAVIGASYDAKLAKSYPAPAPDWTHFYIACLENKNQVLGKTEKPCFRHVNVVELNTSLMRTFQMYFCSRAVVFEDNSIFDISHKGWGDTKKPTVIFAEPLVFDMRCFSFDKDSNCDYWSMRFPMVSKIHFDRSYLDTMSFEELQEAAKEATTAPEQEDSQEMRRWIQDLEKADPRGIAVDAMTSQSTTTSELLCPTPSPMTQRTRRLSGALDMISEEPLAEIAGGLSPDTATHSRPPLTPPRSSAIQAQEVPDSVGSQSDENTQPNVRKRPNNTGRAEKNKRTCEDDLRKPRRSTLTKSPSLRSSRRTPEAIHASSQGRQILGEVGINRSFSDHRLSQPQYQDAATTPTRPPVPSSSVPIQARPQATSPSTRRSPIQRKRTNKRPNTQSTTPSSSICRRSIRATACPHAGSTCALARRSILLAPCIASYALVTDTLLRAHDVSDWVTNPAVWASTSTSPSCGTQENPLCIDDDSFETSAAPENSTTLLPPSTCASTFEEAAPSICLEGTHPNILGGSSPPPSSITKIRHMPKHLRTKGRKICLVEAKRKDATDAFREEIERANLKKQITRKRSSDGKTVRRELREYVEVYDWQVLEDLTDIESGKVAVPKLDPWRRHFVGLA